MTEVTVSKSSLIDDFSSRLSYQLDDFQRSACESLLAGNSVLVSAPTGSGKTTVAEFAVFLAQQDHGAKIFYTAPIKALSNQKFHELCAEYGERQVGLLTGDVNVRGDAPIVVMTTEVLRNMIYSDSETLVDLKFVVLDEVHYLSDKWRGAVWEEIILHLSHDVQMVSLSATVSNAHEFGDWMNAVRGNTEVILSDHRPVPLYHHVLTPRALLPLYLDSYGELAERGTVNPDVLKLRGADSSSSRYGARSGARRSRGSAPIRRFQKIRRSEIAHALEEQDLLPGIVFIFSRNGCDSAVQQCIADGVRLTTADERKLIREAADKVLSDLSTDDARVLGAYTWLNGLEHGIAAHHAGLLPQFKSVVEDLFQRKLVKLVFATETLALGINMPARSVTIEQLEKFNGEERLPLTAAEFTQLTGRAGRRGIDIEGHAVIVWNGSIEAQQLSRLVTAKSFPLRSSFKPTPNMAVNLLQRLSREQARDTLEMSFAQFQADRNVVQHAREMQAEQASLEGYERAAKKAQGSDKKRWQERARKMRKQIERARRRIEQASSNIAQTFDVIITALNTLGYLKGEIVNEWGFALSQLFGERDLLVAECLRSNAWRGITAPGLAALSCALVYEPRRDDEDEPRLPSGAFQTCYLRTLSVWNDLDTVSSRIALGGAQKPHAGLAFAMQGWASGWTLQKTLDHAGLSAGDFVRWSKQTIDLLDQISQLDTRHIAPSEHLVNIIALAAEAKKLVKRGIVETSSGM